MPGSWLTCQILESDLADLVRSLFHQYTFFFEKTPFYKVFENSAGINWGRQQVQQVMNIALPNPAPPPNSYPWKIFALIPLLLAASSGVATRDDNWRSWFWSKLLTRP